MLTGGFIYYYKVRPPSHSNKACHCSNASVCGALLGCKLGYRALPPELMQFPHRAWLDGHVESFLKTVGLA